jgi:hypothetical protein
LKISRRRTAISQSMDLFIIIAAVLGVGGVVTASIYNLVNSASANTSIAVVEASMVAGSGATAAPSAMSVSIKNDGGTPITCSSTVACEVVLAGTNIGTGATVVPSTLVSAPAGWAVLTTDSTPLTFTYSFSASTTVQPGSQVSFLVSGTPLTGSSMTGMPTHGSTVTLSVVFGTASAQVTVIAQ